MRHRRRRPAEARRSEAAAHGQGQLERKAVPAKVVRHVEVHPYALAAAPRRLGAPLDQPVEPVGERVQPLVALEEVVLHQVPGVVQAAAARRRAGMTPAFGGAWRARGRFEARAQSASPAVLSAEARVRTPADARDGDDQLGISSAPRCTLSSYDRSSASTGACSSQARFLRSRTTAQSSP